MAWIETDHADREALSDAVATRIAALTDAALGARGRAALALAGGTTSPPVFRRLAAQPLRWEDVVVVPTDERWVAYAHPDCNLRALRAAFALPGLRSLPLVPDPPAGPPDAGYANTQLSVLPQTLDAVLLGMGADGHFASLFPGAPNLPAALDLAGRADAIAIVPDPMPAAGPHPRVSLSLARLLRAHAVLLAITVADNRATLRRAQSDAHAFPIGALLHAAGARVEIHWSP